VPLRGPSLGERRQKINGLTAPCHWQSRNRSNSFNRGSFIAVPPHADLHQTLPQKPVGAKMLYMIRISPHTWLLMYSILPPARRNNTEGRQPSTGCFFLYQCCGCLLYRFCSTVVQLGTTCTAGRRWVVSGSEGGRNLPSTRHGVGALSPSMFYQGTDSSQVISTSIPCQRILVPQYRLRSCGV
jgi:hypothetical protein